MKSEDWPPVFSISVLCLWIPLASRYIRRINMTDPVTPTSEQITVWLTSWRQGDQNASGRLFAVVYPQLQRIAARFLRNERKDHTLEPGALVNELYVRLLGSEPVAI